MTRRAWYSERRNYSDIRHRYTSKTIRLRLPRRQVCAARVAVTAAPVVIMWSRNIQKARENRPSQNPTPHNHALRIIDVMWCST